MQLVRGSILKLALPYLMASLALSGCFDASLQFANTKPTTTVAATAAVSNGISMSFSNLSSNSVSNQLSPIITGTAPTYAANIFYVYSDAACTTQIASNTIGGGAGAFVANLPTYIGGGGQDGLKQYWYQIKDISTAIKVSCTSTALQYTLDTVQPTIVIGAPSLGIANNGSSVTYLVTYTDTNFSNSTMSPTDITVSVTGTAVCAKSVSGAGNTRTVTLSSCTGDGTAGITVGPNTGFDLAGNVSPGAGPSTTFIVDNTAPTVNIGAPSAVLVKSTATVNYLVTYSDANFLSSTLIPANVILNTSGTANCTKNVSGAGNTRTVSLTSCTGDGTVGISLLSGTATDGVNLAPAAGPSATFTVDNTLPAITLTPPTAYANSGTASAFPINGNCEAGLTVSYSAFDGVLTNSGSVSCPGGTWSTTISLNSTNNLAQGLITFTVNQTDGAGNIGTATGTTTKDTIAPATGIVFNLSGIANTTDSTITNPVFNLSSAEPFSSFALYSDVACTISIGTYSVSGGGTASNTLFQAPTDNTRIYYFKLTDLAGNTTICTNTGFSYWFVSPPVLSTASNYLYPINKKFPGGFVSEDFRNMNNPVGNYDHSMTYSCMFDRVVDGAVSAGTSCTSLPGTMAWNSVTGVFNWSVIGQTFGPYEFKITGTNIAGVTSYIFVVDVGQTVYNPTSNLVYQFDPMFAKANGGNGLNADVGSSTLMDLLSGSTAYVGSWAGFLWNASNGWSGSLPDLSVSERLTPYALKFDGLNYVNFGPLFATYNSQATQLFDLWMSPSASVNAARPIWSNADSNYGLTLRQSVFGDGALELKASTGATYLDTVVTNVGSYLQAFYRLNEYTTDSHVFPTKGFATGVTLGGVTRMQPTPPFNDNSFSMGFNGSNALVKLNSQDIVSGTDFTICAWVNPTTTAVNQTVVAKDNSTNGQKSFALGINSTGNATFTMYSSGGTAFIATDTSTITAASWHLICGQYYNNNYVYVWKDTNTTTGSTSGVGPMVVGSVANNTIGAKDAGGGYFSGKIADVMYMTGIVAPSYTVNLYNAGIGAASKYLCHSRTKVYDGGWYHVSAGFETNTLKFWINDNQECMLSTAGFTASGSTNNPTLGMGNATYWNGQIGPLKLYNASGGAPFGTTNYLNEKSRFKNPILDAPGTMLAWYDANANGFTSAQSVSTWPDLSGNGHTFTQATVPNQPTYQTAGVNGHGAIYFTGSPKSMATAAWNVLVRPGITMFVVGQHATPTASIWSPFGIGSLFSFKFSNTITGFYSPTTSPTAYRTDSDITFGAVPYVYSARASSTTIEARYNGIPNPNGTAAAFGGNINASNDVLYVGVDSVVTDYYAGYVSEIILYDSLFTQAQMSEVEQFLGRKYGFTVK